VEETQQSYSQPKTQESTLAKLCRRKLSTKHVWSFIKNTLGTNLLSKILNPANLEETVLYVSDIKFTLKNDELPNVANQCGIDIGSLDSQLNVGLLCDYLWLQITTENIIFVFGYN